MADLEKLLAALKRASPASVRVVDAADNVRELGVPANHRKRWAQVLTNITREPWIRCEFVDKKGLVLGYYDNADAATDLETIGDGGGPAGPLAIERHLKILVDAQKTALAYRDKEVTDLFTGIREIMSGTKDLLAVNVEAIKQLAMLYQAQVSVAADVAAMQAHAEHGSKMEEWLKLAEVAPELVPKFAPLIAMLFGGRALPAAPKSKPNGATNGTKQ